MGHKTNKSELYSCKIRWLIEIINRAVGQSVQRECKKNEIMRKPDDVLRIKIEKVVEWYTENLRESRLSINDDNEFTHLSSKI